ncbi:MAG: hypothetical protein IJ003_01015 [Candidatus Gastranaerophilales bacterium]|nr:hypothetical protein [Candidatus Gastranaerophilales bacterium]
MNDKATKCPLCGEVFIEKTKICPNCFYKNPLGLRKALWTLIIILLPLTFAYLILQNNDVDSSISSNQSYVVQAKQKEEIKINPMTKLSGLSRKDIFAQRKKYVNSSLVFSHLKNYSPNEDVYRIEDDLAWISAYEIAKNGVKNNPNVGLGDSRHSISINNPELLLSFIVPQFNEGIDKNNFSTTSYFHPTKILWNKKERTIEAFFDITAFKKHHPKFQEVTMYPDETNARDFGYNWVYAPESMGLFFKDRQNNIERRLYRMQGYYHKGYSCGLKEGCNNYSPYQEDMVFTIIDTGYLKLKLWKNKPLSVLKNADMTYIMHFE